MKCCNSGRSAETLHLETNCSRCKGKSGENRCIAAMEAHREKERQDETQFTTKIDGFLWFSEFQPLLNVNVLFCRFFLNLTKLRVLVPCLSYVSITLMCSL
jgi:hypothetical protein